MTTISATPTAAFTSHRLAASRASASVVDGAAGRPRRTSPSPPPPPGGASTGASAGPARRTAPPTGRGAGDGDGGRGGGDVRHPRLDDPGHGREGRGRERCGGGLPSAGRRGALLAAAAAASSSMFVPSSSHCTPFRPADASAAPSSGLAAGGTPAAGVAVGGGGMMVEIADPRTYSAVAYAPPAPRSRRPNEQAALPLLLVLHGAGVNSDPSAFSALADPAGEHRGLPPSLLLASEAPSELRDNFVVLAPYSGRNTQSFYAEPRSKLLDFLSWAVDTGLRDAGLPAVDPDRIFILGFSDGATEAVELLTTGRFAGGVVAAYGFTGTLPPLAMKRLVGRHVWVFHSADDVIFPVGCSDRLVGALRDANDDAGAARVEDGGGLVRYTRFDRDQEGFANTDSPVRGHTVGITASRMPKVYRWMLSI